MFQNNNVYSESFIYIVYSISIVTSVRNISESSVLDENRLRLRVMSKCIFSVLSPNTGVLETSKRNLRIDLDCAIDLNSSCSKLLANSHCAIDILSEDSSGKSEL